MSDPSNLDRVRALPTETLLELVRRGAEVELAARSKDTADADGGRTFYVPAPNGERVAFRLSKDDLEL